MSSPSLHHYFKTAVPTCYYLTRNTYLPPTNFLNLFQSPQFIMKLTVVKSQSPKTYPAARAVGRATKDVTDAGIAKKLRSSVTTVLSISYGLLSDIKRLH